jgi:hypothetical protein
LQAPESPASPLSQHEKKSQKTGDQRTSKKERQTVAGIITPVSVYGQSPANPQTGIAAPISGLPVIRQLEIRCVLQAALSVPIGLVPAHSRRGRDQPNFWYLKMDRSWRSPKNWRLLTDLADAA